MGWFKKLFSNDSDSNYQETLKEDEKYITTEDRKVCDFCGYEIFGEQKTIHKGGKIYHVKPCWRTIQKMAKKEAFG